jgi:hypothetical protein
MAAEFFGNCQICGREQKSHEHAIAKHGYTIQNGWQQGACFGSGAKPYQLSCDLLARGIEHANAYVAAKKGEIATLKKNPLAEDGKIRMMYRQVTRAGDLIYPILVTVKLAESGLPVAIDSQGKEVKKWQSYSDAKTIEAAIKELSAEWLKHLRRNIKEAEMSIEYMTARLNNWKLEPLKPVTAADKAANAPRLHFAAIRYGRKSSACVSSAQGAQTYKMTTENREEVTCLACLKELARIDDLPRLKAEKAAKELASDIKRAERDIKEYTKLLKKAESDKDAEYWKRYLDESTAKLADLTKTAQPQ